MKLISMAKLEFFLKIIMAKLDFKKNKHGLSMAKLDLRKYKHGDARFLKENKYD